MYCNFDKLTKVHRSSFCWLIFCLVPILIIVQMIKHSNCWRILNLASYVNTIRKYETIDIEGFDFAYGLNEF